MPQANDISTNAALNADIKWYRGKIAELTAAGKLADAAKYQKELDERLQAHQ